jgi:hypothetical protein
VRRERDTEIRYGKETNQVQIPELLPKEQEEFQGPFQTYSII